jgi:secreted trypsin-like serine protease
MNIRATAIGIVSGIGKLGSSNPTVYYTQISKYLSWIEKTITSM